MLRRNRTLSIVMTLCLCMALIAPVFIAPPAAQAAVNYQALSVPIVSANTAAQGLGIMQIDIDNCAPIKNGDVLTVSFSSSMNIGPSGAVSVVAVRTAATEEVVVPGLIGGTANALATTSLASASINASNNTLDLVFNGTFSAAGSSNPGRLMVYLTNTTVGSVENEITASLMGPASGVFPQGSVTVAKISSGGATTSTIKSARTFGSNGGTTDEIILTETIPGRIPAGDTIKVKLAPGFRWTAGSGTLNWGWAPGVLGVAVNGSDNRILDLTIPTAPSNSTVGAGQVRFSGTIAIDDSVAKEGEVVATIYDAAGKVTEQDLVVANYASYGVKLVEGDAKTLTAGKSEQKIGKFTIEEGIAGSLLAGRSIKLTLPQGVKWWAGYRDESTLVPAGITNQIPNPSIKKGATIALSDANPTAGGIQAFLVGTNTNNASDQGRTLRFSLAAQSTSKAVLELDNLKVDVSPDFTGDVKISVSSDAGVNGEVKVATVDPAVKLKSENVTNVRIGEQDQALGDIVIVESKKEAVNLRNNTVYTNGTNYAVLNPGNTSIELRLPAGASWSGGYPKVEVTEGNLELGISSMSKSFNPVTGIHSISIPVKSESTKASTIKISGLKATLNRTIPEGEFKVAVDGQAINEVGGVNLPFSQYEGNRVVVAKCVTPAPNEGTAGAAAGQFKIGSNIYQVNGVSKVMDVAPYIKGDRTYVPVRYLGYGLGVAEADVVWDEATQKVTLTKGDNVVEMTIGSTTITVNGEAQTMDVAPEIASDRTMLPARYVAEGLGYHVGWDPGSQTVLISK
ncbi:copper amine oxidase N-terminal domain-containing protein [Syntrophomonas curvata]